MVKGNTKSRSQS